MSQSQKRIEEISKSSSALRLKSQKEKHVLVIYTGGTIGMMKDKNGALVPVQDVMEKTLRDSSQMCDKKYSKKRFGSDWKSAPLVLPELHICKAPRIFYSICEYNPLLDSSNISLENWKNIAKDIGFAYDNFDGFVILHGTDTLAYTSSQLPFMFSNLGKPIVITGSQIPLFDPLSDGRSNLLSALVVAATSNIPEVTVFFDNKLLRGNRTTKINATELNAFDSPNFPPLAIFGTEVKVEENHVIRPSSDTFTVWTDISSEVGILKFTPFTTHKEVTYILNSKKGVVLETFGVGNIPSNQENIVNEIRVATHSGVIIINVTQCLKGRVNASYETGKALLEVGVIPGADMTAEAALAKLSYVLSREDWDQTKKRQMMKANLRGELSPEKPEDLDSLETVHNQQDDIECGEVAASLTNGVGNNNISNLLNR